MSDRRSARLARLRATFVEEAQAEHAELAGLVATGLEGEVARERARKLAHDLHGAGGSYGFKGVSAAARELEEALGPGPLTAIDASGAGAALAALGLALDEAAREVAAAPPPPARRLVIVAEDDRHVRALVELALEPLGLDVELLGDGRDVVERLRRPPVPDALVLDLGLPGASGLDVLSAARELPALARMPALVLSASSGAADRERALQAGARLFMAKPFDVDELGRQLGKLLDDPGGGS